MQFLIQLKQRNPLLFWYGVLNFLAAIICAVLTQTTNTTVLNINAFVKPMKFYVSIGIFVWTMGWLMHYLQMPKKERSFTYMAVIIFTFESFVITWQAVNGRLSHFNKDAPLYITLFSLMGIAISILTAWTGYIGYLFFKKRDINLPASYLWGIRLGILFFVVFAFEGGVMASLFSHTVGSADGGKGLPVVNWSRQHGDLRIAHFLGMHTLQIFPLFGYYIAKSRRTVILFATVYVMMVFAVLIQALMGAPLI
ncbi:MAG: hypothetical protein H0U39_09885 [Segetibacter sp.]|jgi:hypothetical protein|nr:hypothetical protein [Segetibacter sp.]